MSAPAVTVLMPVYNAERFVARTIDSVLAQTFRDFEFVIINDGSTDRSLKILQDYARRDDRIRLVSRPNTGYVLALIEGLGLARGEVEKCAAYDYAIINDDFDAAYRQLRAVVEAARCRTGRQQQRLQAIVREFTGAS